MKQFLVVVLSFMCIYPLNAGETIPCELSKKFQKNKIELIDLSLRIDKDNTNSPITFFFITNKPLGSASFTLYDKSGKPFRRIALRKTDIINNQFASSWKTLRKYKSSKFKDEIFDIKDHNFLYMKSVDFLEKSLIKRITIEPYTPKL